MKKSILGNGIPISVSLDSELEHEQREPRKENKKRLLTISFLAFAIAVIVSFISKVLVALIFFFTNLFFYGNLSFTDHGPAGNHLGLFVIIIPVVGGFIVGLMALYGSKAIRGHGIPEAMEQVLTNESKIKPAIAFLKPVSAAISIGTGGPFGAEGPIIATGGALGSTLGQLATISNQERKILLSAGATAGMSAIFGTPIAAIFLAIELLLFEFSPRSIIPVSIACITGAAGHHLLFSQAPVFGMGNLAVPGNYAILAYTCIGIMIGLLAVLVTKAVYFIEDSFEKLPVHWMWWPAMGGLAVGVVGYFAPRTLGVGYDNITDLLSGTVPLQIVVSLCLMKFISWAIALGSGTSGGTLAPLLTIGGATGAISGYFLLLFFPECGITIPLCALVGMSAMFAGASRALLTSIVFSLEATMQSNALLPLLSACIASYFVSYFLMENTIMTEKIARRGVSTPHSYEPDILEKIRVEEVMAEEGLVINENNGIAEVKEWLKAEKVFHDFFILVDENNGFRGIVRAADLSGVAVSQKKIGELQGKKRVSIRAKDTLKKAVELMANEDLDILAVTDNTGQLISTISFRDILPVYRKLTHDREKYRAISIRRSSLKILIRGQKMMTVVKKTKTEGAEKD
ncbi:MAG: chloride channel protein [Bacteroidia bacterium]